MRIIALLKGLLRFIAALHDVSYEYWICKPNPKLNCNLSKFNQLFSVP